jgi:hypothetical protein
LPGSAARSVAIRARATSMSAGLSGPRFDPLDAAGQGGQQGLGLQAGHVLADALVDAHAETDVPGGVAGEVEAVGVVPSVRVAVGRAEEHEDLRVGGDERAGDGDVGGGGTEEGLHR